MDVPMTFFFLRQQSVFMTSVDMSSYMEIRRMCLSLLTRSGHTCRAQRVWNQAITHISHDHAHVQHMVCQALDMCAPIVSYRRVRVAGTSLQVPKLLTPHQARAQGLRWILEAAHRRHGYEYGMCLGDEFVDAARGQGWAVQQRYDMHRIAEANRAYTRYQWWTL